MMRRRIPVGLLWGGLLVALAALLVGVGIQGMAPGRANGEGGRSREEPLAPAFTLRDIEGKEVRFAPDKGKVYLLDFWATWCGPCRASVPHLSELHRKHKEKGFEVVGISMDRGGVQVVRDFVEKYAIPYTILMADDKVTQLYGGVYALPTAFLIGRDGRVKKVYIGYRGKEELERDILPFLKARKS